MSNEKRNASEDHSDASTFSTCPTKPSTADGLVRRRALKGKRDRPEVGSRQAATEEPAPEAKVKPTRPRACGKTVAEAAYKIARAAQVEGADFAGMCDALRENKVTSDWFASQQRAEGERVLRELWSRTSPRGPVITVAPGRLHLTATEAEAAILKSGLPIFQRGETLVRPVLQEIPVAHGKVTCSATLREITPASAIDVLSQVAHFRRFDARANDYVDVDPPQNVAHTLLSRAGQWSVPRIAGIVTTPTIRPDGTILSAPGYDEVTRLYHVADPALRLSAIPDRPTKGDARRALDLLQRLLDDFPFVGDVDRAVALSAILTAVARGAMKVAPLHAINANTPGSGKSYFVDLTSTIATGRPCPVTAAGRTEEETEKRLVSLLLSAVPIASIDNVNGELGGDLLCQAIERPLLKIRPLGTSESVEIEARTIWMATGNGLTIVGDMARRTLRANLDAGIERPELRIFDTNPVRDVLANRGVYVAAALTIVRAYVVAGIPGRLPLLASFSDWSDFVRSPLVWLGCADPVASMEAAREDDPTLVEHKAVLAAWAQYLKLNREYTAKQLVDAAEAKVTDPTSGLSTAVPRAPELRDALAMIAERHGAINTKVLGRWLISRNGRVAGKYKIEKLSRADRNGLALWVLRVLP